MRPPETWAALASEHGYADQAHMVREFHAFGVEPPTHFFTADWYDTTGLSRVSGELLIGLTGVAERIVT
jgi:hypothetical protein